MSWLSSLTGIHISAPPVIQNLGDTLVGLGLKAVPGGNTLNSMFNLDNSNKAYNASAIVDQTQRNIYAQGQGAYVGASYVANQQAGGYASLMNNPLVLVAVAVALVLLLRRR